MKPRRAGCSPATSRSGTVALKPMVLDPFQFFAEEVAKPHGLEFYTGMPASVDRNRVAHLHGWSAPEMLFHLGVMPPRFVAAVLNPRSLAARAFNIPGMDAPADLNREELRVVEIPASNGIGTARSVANGYGAVATGGSDLGITASTLDALTQPPMLPTHGTRDKVLHVDSAFSLGFFKPFPKFGFADPDTGIGFAYVMNRLGFHSWSDPRELVLRQVLFHDIVGARPQT